MGEDGQPDLNHRLSRLETCLRATLYDVLVTPQCMIESFPARATVEVQYRQAGWQVQIVPDRNGRLLYVLRDMTPSNGLLRTFRRPRQAAHHLLALAVGGSSSEVFREEQAPPQFVIFAHPRSGSKSLCRLLEQHPSVVISREPFNPNRGSHRGRVSDPGSLEQCLGEVLELHSGLKHLAYQLPRGLNEVLLSSGLRVILLHRLNALRAAVSAEISQQSRHFGQRREEILSHEYSPASVLDVRRRMQRLASQVERYRNHLVSGRIQFHDLCYEELFGEELTETQKLARLESVYGFLGLSTDRCPNPALLRRILDPAITKINSATTYRLIPNIDEIESTLGSPETGYLFR